MRIQTTPNHQPKTLNANQKPNTTATTYEPSDSFLQSHGLDIGVGSVLGMMSAIPGLGAATSYNLASTLMAPKEYGRGLSAFELGGAAVAGGAAIANVCGTVALFTGQTNLALGLLGGAGLACAAVGSLAMDGGSLASRLGLQK